MEPRCFFINAKRSSTAEVGRRCRDAMALDLWKSWCIFATFGPTNVSNAMTRGTTRSSLKPWKVSSLRFLFISAEDIHPESIKSISILCHSASAFSQSPSNPAGSSPCSSVSCNNVLTSVPISPALSWPDRYSKARIRILCSVHPSSEVGQIASRFPLVLIEMKTKWLDLTNYEPWTIDLIHSIMYLYLYMNLNHIIMIFVYLKPNHIKSTTSISIFVQRPKDSQGGKTCHNVVPQLSHKLESPCCVDPSVRQRYRIPKRE